MVKIAIIIHSLWGHVKTLSTCFKKGVEAAGGNVTCDIYQVPETLTPDILQKMKAAKFDLPVMTVDKLKEYDGLVFGTGTRYGLMSAQMKAFWDATGQLWASGALIGKMGAVFFSTGSQHGGQETTALTFVTHFAHHGIIFVPLGYANPHLSNNTEVIGGSAYGAGTIAHADGSRQPSQKEMELAEYQGKEFAKTLATYVKGKSA